MFHVTQEDLPIMARAFIEPPLRNCLSPKILLFEMLNLPFRALVLTKAYARLTVYAVLDFPHRLTRLTQKR